jgi:hypothetical protein
MLGLKLNLQLANSMVLVLVLGVVVYSVVVPVNDTSMLIPSTSKLKT